MRVSKLALKNCPAVKITANYEMNKLSQSSVSIELLLEVMRALRTPVTGCPWDLEQNFESIAPYTLEEAYEVVDAIERRDMDDLQDELGDLLLQVVFHAQMASEDGLFTFSDVLEKIIAKMIRRHPHVFGDTEARSSGAVKGMWEDIKAAERDAKRGNEAVGILDDVPRALPALLRAAKLQKRASRVGFEWDDIAPVFDKIREEIDELEAATKLLDGSEKSKQEQQSELGDVLFSVVNLSRHLGHDPETALTTSSNKFIRRFSYIEHRLADDGRKFEDTSLEELETLWQASKTDEV